MSHVIYYQVGVAIKVNEKLSLQISIMHVKQKVMETYFCFLPVLSFGDPIKSHVYIYGKLAGIIIV